MGFKGVIQPDHMQVSKYSLQAFGLPPLTPVKVGGIEEELDNPELPDRTTHTGGRTKPVEFDVEIAMHHTLEILAMDSWMDECIDPVSPLHKKQVLIFLQSQSNANLRSYMIRGCFPQKRALPDLEMENDGDLATVTYTLKGDEVKRVF